jgi:outer membrane protein assembly factor BamB
MPDVFPAQLRSVLPFFPHRLSLLVASTVAIFSAGMGRAEDWPTYRHDQYRSGVTADSIDAKRLESAWVWRSAAPPQPAWYGPALWDAYAEVSGLRSMRDYDSVFHAIIAGDRIYFGSSTDDSVHCLDANSGESIWTFTTDGPVRVPPTFWEGKIYFGSDDGYAYCVTADRGQQRWKVRATEPGTRVLHNGRFISFWPCRSGVAIADGLAYFAMSLLPWKPSYLCAVDAETGAEDVEGGFIRELSQETFEGSLVVHGDHLIAPRGRVAPKLFLRRDGSPLVELSDGGGSFLTVNQQGQVFHGPGNKRGWIVGSQGDKQEKFASFPGGTALVSAEKTMFLLTDAQLSALDPSTRELLWTTPCHQYSSLIKAGDTLFAGGEDVVAAWNARDGQLIWSHAVQGTVHGLAVAGGRLVVSTDSGVVCAFAETANQAGAPQADSADAALTAEVAAPSSVAGSVPRLGRQRRVLGRWVFEAPDMRGRLVRDSAAAQHARIEGPINTELAGDFGAIVLDGERTTVLINDHLKQAQLPEQNFSVEARLRIDQPLEWGGILGAVQDNGSFEKGWLLGYRNSHFCLAVNGVGGPDRLTYLTSPEPFELGRWYHVAGTYDGHIMRLFVDGREVCHSDEQSGPIQYPDEGFFQIGAYHDKDEDFRLTGMIHEVILHDWAFAPGQVERIARRKNLAAINPQALAVGPWLEFTGPATATVRWRTEDPSPTILEYGIGKQIKVVRDDALKREHHAELVDLPWRRQVRYMIRFQQHQQQLKTPWYLCDNFFNYSVPNIGDWTDHADAARQADGRVRQTAATILKVSGVDRGLCLVLGCVDGRLAYELARQSRLNVVVLDPSPDRVATVRRHLLEAGVYGHRLTVLPIDSWSEVPVADQVANLVVSERVSNPAAPAAWLGQVQRWLKPYGGQAVFGTLDTAHETTVAWDKWAAENPCWRLTCDEHGCWARCEQRATGGHGSWTHLYGRPNNSAFGGETLGDARTIQDLEVQWIGRPGPRYQADRNGRKPSPLAANGRLVLQGLNRLVALDTHNGFVLWSIEIPTLGRYNMPRDCANWCMDDEFVYTAVADRCWKIDGKTGQVVEVLKTRPGSDKEWELDWGYIASVERQLIGSSVRQGTSFASFWGDANAGWYDSASGRVTAKVCSENLFAIDKETGVQRWSYEGGLLVNPTISLTEERAFFIECRNAYERDKTTRRLEGPNFWKDQFLVAIDLETGKKLWEQPIQLHQGSVVFYMAEGSEKLTVVCSDSKKFFVYVFSAEDGQPVWENQLSWFEDRDNHGRHMSRPAIVDDRLYVRPAVFDLNSGEKLEQILPDGGCGTYACTSRAVIYRDSVVTMWDSQTGRTTGWTRVRPDCWLSTIPACGMLLSPEGGGGCSCGSWMETSLAFRPRKPQK